MEVVNRSASVPFTTKDGSIIRKLLEPSNSSITNQSLAEAIVPPQTRTIAHRHHVSEEIYYILHGTGTMLIEDEQIAIKPFDAIAIPPYKIHSISNTSTSDLIFLCTCSPAYTHEDTELLNDL